jgi:hypothetical protein
MSLDLEKARVMFKLVRKNNWGAKYDRLEHFKRFQKIDQIIDELTDKEWIIIHKKPRFTGISLNTIYKTQIKEFTERYMSYLKGMNWIT